MADAPMTVVETARFLKGANPEAGEILIPAASEKRGSARRRDRLSKQTKRAVCGSSNLVYTDRPAALPGNFSS
jgi:hypothetical protein